MQLAGIPIPDADVLVLARLLREGGSELRQPTRARLDAGFTRRAIGHARKTMADIKRYTFRFDGATEVHYLPHAPEVGERVTHGRELWFVAELSSDSVGDLVICKRTNPARGGNGRAVEAHIARR